MEDFEALFLLINTIDTSIWLPMEIRPLPHSGTIGINKEKSALYIKNEDGSWKRTMELFIDKSFEEIYN